MRRGHWVQRTSGSFLSVPDTITIQGHSVSSIAQSNDERDAADASRSGLICTGEHVKGGQYIYDSQRPLLVQRRGKELLHLDLTSLWELFCFRITIRERNPFQTSELLIRSSSPDHRRCLPAATLYRLMIVTSSVTVRIRLANCSLAWTDFVVRFCSRHDGRSFCILVCSEQQHRQAFRRGKHKPAASLRLVGSLWGACLRTRSSLCLPRGRRPRMLLRTKPLGPRHRWKKRPSPTRPQRARRRRQRHRKPGTPTGTTPLSVTASWLDCTN